MFNKITFIILILLTSTLFASEHSLLKSRLGESYSNGDPYAQEYKDTWPLMRYAVLKKQRGDLYLFDNFRNGVHQLDEGVQKGKWGSVLVDASKIKKVSLMISIFYIEIGGFKYRAGHGQMVFDFHKNGVVTEDGDVGGLVVSYEAFRNKDVPYSAFKGLKKTYHTVAVVSSRRDSFERAAERDDGVELYELELTPEKQKELLEKFFEEAFDRDYLYNSWYHTTRNSCVTNQIRVLNKVLEKKRQIPEWNSLFGIKLFKSLASFLPRRIGRMLEKKDLVKNKELLETKEAVREYARKNYSGDAESNRDKSLFLELYRD